MSELAVSARFAMKGDGIAFFSFLAGALFPSGLGLSFSVGRGESGSTPEAGGDLSLAIQAGFVLCPVVATAGASVCHHDGLLQHRAVYRMEGFWF